VKKKIRDSFGARIFLEFLQKLSSKKNAHPKQDNLLGAPQNEKMLSDRKNNLLGACPSPQTLDKRRW
jgi:hypothetical protein